MDDYDDHNEALAAEYEQQREDDYREAMAIDAYLRDRERDDDERARRAR